jgi:hypothetical protein
MDAAERKRLKKLGKQTVEQRSRDLQEQLRDANPAPIGSDDWVKNYKASTNAERQLRVEQPDVIPAAVARAKFVLRPVEPAPLGVPLWYIECPTCGDLLHTVPRRTVQCTCGSLELNVELRRISVQSETKPRWVTLIGRGGKAMG